MRRQTCQKCGKKFKRGRRQRAMAEALCPDCRVNFRKFVKRKVSKDGAKRQGTAEG